LTPPQAARVIGWAFAIWGTALYWWAAVLYLTQTRQIIAAGRGNQAMIEHGEQRRETGTP